MKRKTIAYAVLIAAAGMFVIGSSGTSEAKAKVAAATPYPGPCFTSSAPVCGVKGGMKFTYASSCYASKDGAKIVSQHACSKPKAHKAKKASKPAKKAEMKKPATPAKKMDAKK